jgi:hypothetical protein
MFFFIGDFHADFTGYSDGEGPGGGRNANEYESGGSGGAHAGRGGPSMSGIFSSYAHDSITLPSDMGSSGGNSPDGNGGRGGGMFI